MKPVVASIFALLITLLAVPSAAEVQSEGTVADERLIARCIHQSARGKRWLESTLLGIRDQEGGWIGAAVRNRDGRYDLGPMQINSWWVPRMARLLGRPPESVRLWLRDEACFNIEAARWILLMEFFRTRDIWMAIASYHSPEHVRRHRYLLAVAAKMRQRKDDRRHVRPGGL
ncbi:murein transglycosylase [Sphingomonas sp. 2R-10]|uniref:murein transglycosylase n=1 Tax=Sphingomonas sp. 2R-10 TaxID=3045148 RepID=UPI000F7AAA9A|nr:murein transglycosylase [Sphingomonas sp. 2R-10]MDJ0276266.1 murein transglycosylase [Sphingomonas sp. 2R-10]